MNLRPDLAAIAAQVAPGSRVLDIGCGWGGMCLYLTETAKAREAFGVTLSTEQLEVAQRRAAERGASERARFALQDYRDVTGTFDRIVSVGMFEHVGPPQYRTFFRKCRDLLTEDGVMLLHTIGRLGGPGVTDDWTTKYIFPGGLLPSVEAVDEVTREHTSLRLVERFQFGTHYAETLRLWDEAFLDRAEEVLALGFDEVFLRMWHFYLEYSRAGFASGYIDDYQLLWERP